MVPETKLDESFPNSELHMAGFSLPYRLDKNPNSGGIMIFVTEDIPSKLSTKHNIPCDVEVCLLNLILENQNAFSLALITQQHKTFLKKALF